MPPVVPALPMLGASTAGVQPELPEPSPVAGGLPGAAAAAAAATGVVVDDGEHTQRGDDEIAEFGELTQRMQRKVRFAPTPWPG